MMIVSYFETFGEPRVITIVRLSGTDLYEFVLNALRTTVILSMQFNNAFHKFDVTFAWKFLKICVRLIMFFREGFVQFCANSFSTRNMHESIYLSNVKLQKKYHNVRHPNILKECMWNYQDLKNHLK